MQPKDIKTYGEWQPEPESIHYGIFNDEDILLAYCEYHDEMSTVAKGRVIVTLNAEQLTEELVKASKYYGVE